MGIPTPPRTVRPSRARGLEWSRWEFSAGSPPAFQDCFLPMDCRVVPCFEAVSRSRRPSRYSAAARFYLLALLFLIGAASVHATARLNEFLAAPEESVLTDEDGQVQEWIELFNAGSVPVNLSGWSLTDNPELPGQWIFPAVTVPNGGYLLVF